MAGRTRVLLDTAIAFPPPFAFAVPLIGLSPIFSFLPLCSPGLVHFNAYIERVKACPSALALAPKPKNRAKAKL